MVHAGDVVADRGGCPRTDEDRACVADEPYELVGVGGHELEVLRRDQVHDAHRVLGIIDENDGARLAHGVADGGLDHGVDRGGDVDVPRDEDGAAPRPVLGLCRQIGGGELGRRAGVGDDDHLRRSRERVDADHARDFALGGGHVGVPRPHDHVDGADALGAVRERRDRLGTAHPVQLGDADRRRGGERRLRDAAVGTRWHAERELGDAGDLRRDRRHQHRRRVRGPAAGDVQTGAVDGEHVLLDFDAGAVETGRRVHLLLVVRAYLTARVLERRPQCGFGVAEGPFDLVHWYAQLADRSAVEPLREFAERLVAALADPRE